MREQPGWIDPNANGNGNGDDDSNGNGQDKAKNMMCSEGATFDSNGNVNGLINATQNNKCNWGTETIALQQIQCNTCTATIAMT